MKDAMIEAIAKEMKSVKTVVSAIREAGEDSSVSVHIEGYGASIIASTTMIIEAVAKRVGVSVDVILNDIRGGFEQSKTALREQDGLQ